MTLPSAHAVSPSTTTPSRTSAATATPCSSSASPLGAHSGSTGRWEGDTLIVETTHGNFGHLQGRGVPLSDDVHFLERFTLADNGGRLDYEITITDESSFTAPVTLSKYWVYISDVSVEPYECIPDQ